MVKEYKIKCKLCGDILQTKVPIKNEIKCSCGNMSIYSDYIGYGYINHLSAQECDEQIDN